jgi:hypothetical protein
MLGVGIIFYSANTTTPRTDIAGSRFGSLLIRNILASTSLCHAQMSMLDTGRMDKMEAMLRDSIWRRLACGLHFFCPAPGHATDHECCPRRSRDVLVLLLHELSTCLTSTLFSQVSNPGSARFYRLTSNDTVEIVWRPLIRGRRISCAANILLWEKKICLIVRILYVTISAAHYL